MSVEVLRLRLERCPEPLAAFAALCDNGRQHGTALLESAASGHGGTQRSLLALRPAVRVSLDGEHVKVRASNANGRAALGLFSHHCGYEAENLPRELQLPASRNDDGPRDEHARLREPCVFDPLRTLLATLAPARRADADRVMLIGALSFELSQRFDPLPPLAADGLPEYVFTLPDVLLEIDHRSGAAELAAIAFDALSRNDLARTLQRIANELEALVPVSAQSPAPGTSAIGNCDDAAFRARVETARAAIRAGDVFQLVLSRHWTLPCADPLAAYSRLRRDNPSPYLFYLCDESATLFGASPECALRFDAATREVELYPVAGTRPRGRDAEEDARLEAGLRLDAKEIAEHMMLVDLARNDIARVCEPGTRRVPLLLGVDRYAHVMHLVSRVQGKLRADLDALHALRACLNMGTLSGAPKLRASELIRDVERERRGFYGGAVGRLDAAGNLDTAITIRAATVRNGNARVQAGAGVVLASDPQAEADETQRKARAVLNAIANPETHA
ncbi:MAG TPA: anthranilate synthase component 1 [Gammaproteobacteria bacterium]